MGTIDIEDAKEVQSKLVADYLRVYMPGREGGRGLAGGGISVLGVFVFQFQ